VLEANTLVSVAVVVSSLTRSCSWSIIPGSAAYLAKKARALSSSDAPVVARSVAVTGARKRTVLLWRSTITFQATP